MPTIFNKIRVLGTLTTEDTVNGRDITLAAPLSGHILLDSPLSFGTVSASRLRTKDFVSGIDMDKWFATALQRWSPRPQNITGHWHIRNATFDTLAVGDQINGMDIPTFIGRLDNSLKRSGRIPAVRKCEAADSVIDFSQSTVQLSNFESAFKIQFLEPINSAHPFNYRGQNYFLFNAGCDTFVYGWTDQNRTLVPLNMERTGFVSQWIQVVDPENRLFFVSNNDWSQPIDKCARAGAFVWKFSTVQNALQLNGQFGSIGEFRSMQVNPKNSTNFFAIRNEDNNIAEFDVRGRLIAIWRTTNVTNTDNSKFVLREANLGLAIADNDTVKMLHSTQSRVKRCAFFSKIDWNKHREARRQAIDQSMEKLRTDLEASRNVLHSILNSDEKRLSLASQLHQLHKSQFDEFMQRSNERLSALLNFNKRPDNESLRAAQPNFDKFTVGMNKKGKLIVDIMDKVYEWIRENEEFHRAYDGDRSYPMDYGRQNINEESPIDSKIQTMRVANHDLSSSNAVFEPDSSVVDRESSNSSADILSSPMLGAVEVEIDDDWEQHPHAKYYEQIRLGDQNTVEPPTTEQPTDLPINLNSASNEPELGTIIGFLMLERTLAHTVNRAADALFGEDKKRTKNIFGMDDYKDADLNLFPKLFATHDEQAADERSASADRILQMISHAEYVTQNEQKQQTDELVGMDFMGTWLYNLEPFADKIADELSDEIRHRRHKHQYPYDDSYGGMYSVGATQFDNVETTTEKKSSGWWGGVKSGFRKMGHAMVKVYVFGKEKYKSARKYFNEAEEFLYGYIDDNENDDRSYGPTDNYPNPPKTTNKPKHSTIDTIKKALPSMKDLVKSFSIEMLKTFVGARSTGGPVNFWSAIKEAAKVALKSQNPNATDAEMAKITEESEEFADAIFENFNKTAVDSGPSGKGTASHSTGESAGSGPHKIKSENDSKHSKSEANAKAAEDTTNIKHAESAQKESDPKSVKTSGGSHEHKTKIVSNESNHHTNKQSIKTEPVAKEIIGNDFDKLYNKFQPLINLLSDQIIDDLEARHLIQGNGSEANEFGGDIESTTGLESTLTTIPPELSGVTDAIEMLLGIEHEQPLTTTQSPQLDRETLDDLTNELNALADLLSAKLIEELRQQHNLSDIELDGADDSHTENLSEKNESLRTDSPTCTENVTMSEISQQITDLDADTLRVGAENAFSAHPGEQHRFDTTTLPIPGGMARQNGEMIAIKVYENRKHLFVVSSLAPNNDRIQVS